MTPPKHIVSAAAIVVNDKNELEIEIIRFCGIFQNVGRKLDVGDLPNEG